LICFAPNKNNQNVVEEQRVSCGHKFFK